MPSPAGNISRQRVFKLAVAAILPLLLFGLTNPYSGSTDLEKMKLNGAVRSLMEINYELMDGPDSTARGPLIHQEQTLFDREGLAVEKVIYENGIALTVLKFLFDSAGNRILLREFDREGNPNLTVYYSNNEKGHRVREDYVWADYEPEKEGFGFEVTDRPVYNRVMLRNDYRGYVIEERYFHPDSTLAFMFSYKYDFKGNKEEMNYYDSDERLRWRKTYKYDRYNLLVESRMFKDNRVAIKSVFSYEFDEYRNWVRRWERKIVYKNIYTPFLDTRSVITSREIDYYEDLSGLSGQL